MLFSMTIKQYDGMSNFLKRDNYNYLLYHGPWGGLIFFIYPSKNTTLVRYSVL